MQGPESTAGNDLTCTQPVLSSVPYIVPRALPVMIPEHRANGNPKGVLDGAPKPNPKAQTKNSPC